MLYYIAYKIYVTRDMFYHNLCYISLFGLLNLGMTTCALLYPSLSLTLTGGVRLRLRSWPTLSENPQASRNPRISQC